MTAPAAVALPSPPRSRHAHPTRRAAALAVVLAVACGRGGDAPRTAGAAPAAVAAPAGGVGGSAASAPAVAAPAKPPCLHDGRWRACALTDRLERAGLVPKAGTDTVRYDFLSVPGVRWRVGGAELHVFLYGDGAAADRDVAALDTARVSPRGTFRHWDTRPVLVRSGNLVAILLTLNDRLAERVQLALTAGAPQAGSAP